MPGAAGALDLPDLADIRAARERIAGRVHRTPVLTCAAIDATVSASLHFKCEHLQKIGAFKSRGACNAVFSLPEDEARRGVLTHSSGNHGAALAYAAQQRGIPAWVVMPENAPRVKQDNVRRFGAGVRLCAPTLAAREASLRGGRGGDRGDADPPVRQPAGHRGSGHGGAGVARGGARARRRRGTLRRRRPPVRHRDCHRVGVARAPACSAPSPPMPTTPPEASRAAGSSRWRARRPSPTACALRSRRAR